MYPFYTEYTKYVDAFLKSSRNSPSALTASHLWPFTVIQLSDMIRPE